MDLLAYLIALDGGDHQAPDKLVLPQQFVAELGKLATASESKGLEHGCALMCDRQSATFSYGKVDVGLPTSMNIPVSTHANNFGNVHGHPSASIGHGGGHSAHSMQDLGKFKDTQKRSYFFQFVAAGTRIYSMVQVRGISTWDDTATGFLGKRQGEEEGDMFEAAVHAAGGPDAFMERKADLPPQDSAAAEAMMTELKAKANVGKLMQTVSIKNCTDFAQTYHYFFYAGEGTFLTRAA
jgi:hypothetical protein